MDATQILSSPSGAVLGLIAVISVGALALALKQLLANRKNGNGNGHGASLEAIAVKVGHNTEDLKRLEMEINALRRRGHDHSNLVATATLQSTAALKRLDRLEDRVAKLEDED